MATLRTDSPASRSIVASFLRFLSSVEAAPGTDAEGLEVAAQCLSEVFGLNSPEINAQIHVRPLVDLFTSGVGSDVPASPGPSRAEAGHLPSATSNGVLTRSHDEPLAERSASELLKAEATSSSGESLLEQFQEGLDLAGYFEGTMLGTPEYSEKVEQAKQTLDAALNKVKSSQVTPKWSAAYSEETLALAEAFKVQGNTTMSALRYHDAIQLYTLAISLCSNNAIYYSNRAAALTQVGKYDEAIADCEVAIKLDPQYSKAYSRMGLVYFAQGRLQEAIEKGFRKAMDLDPSSTSVQENLRAAQQKLEEQQRSRQHQVPNGPSETQQNSRSFSASSGPMNIPMAQLPPEIATLLPGIFLNLASQFGQQASGAQPPMGSNQSADNGGRHTVGVNFGNGDGISMDPEVAVDGNFNATFDGQQVPPQYAGFRQSVFQQMFGAMPHPGQTGFSPGSNENPNAQPGPPGGSNV